LKIKGAVSDILVSAFFEKRTVEMSITLRPPDDKTLKGQVGWLKKQIDICSKKSADAFQKMENETIIEVAIKNTSKAERFYLSKIDNIPEELKGKELREFKIICLKDFGKSFSNRRKFVEIIEEMLIDYYRGIVQHMKKWEKPAPKIPEKVRVISEMDIKENSENGL
jgi:hypothetical protein